MFEPQMRAHVKILVDDIIVDNTTVTKTTLATVDTATVTVTDGSNKGEQYGKTEVAADPKNQSNQVLKFTKTKAGDKLSNALSFPLTSSSAFASSDVVRISMRIYVDDLLNNQFVQMRFKTDKGEVYMPEFKGTKNGFEFYDHENFGGSSTRNLITTLTCDEWHTFTWEFSNIDNDNFSVTILVDGEQVAVSTNYYTENNTKNEFDTGSLSFVFSGTWDSLFTMYFDDITVTKIG